MFRFHFPEPDATRRIQDGELAFYWSRCAEGWLRKRGLVAHLEGGAAADFHLVGRATVPSVAPAAVAGLLEGPLAPPVAAALGLAVVEDSADRLALALPAAASAGGADTEPQQMADFVYPHFDVRRVPGQDEPFEEPSRFAPADPRHQREAFSFQSFDLAGSAGGWQPLLVGGPAGCAGDAAAMARPLAVTDGRRLVFGFPVLDLLCSLAQMGPMPAAYYSTQMGEGQHRLEDWLEREIIRLALAEGGRIVRARRWPRHRSWAMSLRVDYDRLISDSELAAYLALSKRHGLPLSWQFLPARCIERQAAAIAAGGNEICLHSEAFCAADFGREIEFVERQTGKRPRGATAHGGRGARGHSGDMFFAWSERAELDYTELIGYDARLPQRINRVHDDLPRTTRLMAPAAHYSLDYDTAAPGFAQTMVAPIDASRRGGGQFVLMNHPDLHFAELTALLAAIDYDGCWRTTLGGATAWADALCYGSRVTPVAHGVSFALGAELGEEAVVELVSADGVRSAVLPAGAGSVVL